MIFLKYYSVMIICALSLSSWSKPAELNWGELYTNYPSCDSSFMELLTAKKMKHYAVLRSFNKSVPFVGVVKSYELSATWSINIVEQSIPSRETWIDSLLLRERSKILGIALPHNLQWSMGGSEIRRILGDPQFIYDSIWLYGQWELDTKQENHKRVEKRMGGTVWDYRHLDVPLYICANDERISWVCITSNPNYRSLRGTGGIWKN